MRSLLMYRRHRLSSSGNSVSRMSQLESRFTGHRNQPQPESYIVSPYHNQVSPCAWDTPPGYTVRPVAVARAIEPTHFHWNTSSRRKQRRNNIPSDGRPPADYKTVMNCNVSIGVILESSANFSVVQCYQTLYTFDSY